MSATTPQHEEIFMLVFYSAYTLEQMHERKLTSFLSYRDINGFFDAVVHINLLAHLQKTSTTMQNLETFRMDKRNLVLETNAGRFDHLLPRKLSSLIRITIAISRIYRTYRIANVSLIRAEDPRFNGLVGLLFSRLFRCPLVVGTWGNPERIRRLEGKPLMPGLFPSRKLEALVESFVFKRANRIVVQNWENAQYPLSLGVDRDLVSFFPVATTLAPIHFGVKTGARDVTLSKELNEWIANRKIVVCISRLEKLKNVTDLLGVVKLLPRTDYCLMLIGDGNLRFEIEEELRHPQLKDMVKVVGNRDQDWIAGLLDLTYCALVPLGGRALMEISLHGVPSIAYDVDWHREIITDDMSGFLVGDREISDMARRLGELLDNIHLRDIFSKNIREAALMKADISLIAKEQEHFYRIMSSHKNK